MPRPFKLHPFSLIAGAFVVGMAMLSMSDAPVLLPRGANIEYVARPQDMIQIREGTPFVVPAGKILVPTALGTTTSGDSVDWVEFRVDGTQEGRMPAWGNGTVVPASLAALPDGESVQAGSTVILHSSIAGNAGRLWGYLMSVGTSPVGSTDTVRVPYLPHPRDLVQIPESKSYTVPDGMLFVLTGLGGTNGGPPNNGAVHALSVNGVVEVSAIDPYAFVLPALPAVPTGFTVPGGSTIEVAQVSGSLSPGRAWGYLAPQ